MNVGWSPCTLQWGGSLSVSILDSFFECRIIRKFYFINLNGFGCNFLGTIDFDKT
jgi:hypothetical protein